MSMKPSIKHMDLGEEYATPERCSIIELSNTADDPSASIARARVASGVTTRRHRLKGIVERYVILEGSGLVEIEGLEPREVGPGDVVLIPASCPQRITCIGREDLIFLAVCTPRFRPESYEDIDTAPGPEADED